MDENKDLLIAIEDIKLNYEMQMRGISSLKNTASTLLGRASIVTAMLALFQLVGANVIPGYMPFYKIGMFLVLGLYIALIILCGIVLSPSEFSVPSLMSLDGISALYEGKTEREMLKNRTEFYLLIITHNETKINRMKKLMQVANVFLPLIVIVVLALSFIPK